MEKAITEGFSTVRVATAGTEPVGYSRCSLEHCGVQAAGNQSSRMRHLGESCGGDDNGHHKHANVVMCRVEEKESRISDEHQLHHAICSAKNRRMRRLLEKIALSS